MVVLKNCELELSYILAELFNKCLKEVSSVVPVFKNVGERSTAKNYCPAQAKALDISKTFDRVWHAGLLHKLKSYGISSQIFGLISSFLANDDFKWFWMESLHKNIQLMLDFPKGPFLVLHFSTVY